MDKIKIILGKILISSLNIFFTSKSNHHTTNKKPSNTWQIMLELLEKTFSQKKNHYPIKFN